MFKRLRKVLLTKQKINLPWLTLQENIAKETTIRTEEELTVFKPPLGYISNYEQYCVFTHT